MCFPASIQRGTSKIKLRRDSYGSIRHKHGQTPCLFDGGASVMSRVCCSQVGEC